MRRATDGVRPVAAEVEISIHALHEESDHCPPSATSPHEAISIHALHEESDDAQGRRGHGRPISIHALHEESDVGYTNTHDNIRYFNPRSP